MTEKSKKSGQKSSSQHAANIRKGKIVEAVVALLHDRPGVKVETNVQLPPKHGDPSRRREIDVLITGEIAGYEARVAISCKNERLPIKPNLIDEFIGTLDDVGIPPEHGIFVCVNGYTKGALDRARSKGIKTLVLRGLTKDRLASEVAKAFQFGVYLLADVIRISVTNNIGTAGYEGQFLVFCDAQQELCGTILDLIFDRWQKCDPPSIIGEYDLNLEVPKGWHQFVEGELVPVLAASCTVRVIGLTIELSGKTHRHSLIDPLQNVVERSRFAVTFDMPKKGESLPITAVSSEEDLTKFLNRTPAIRVVVRIRLPRILCGNIYYPFSERVGRLMLTTRTEDPPTHLTFAGVEGTDLHAVWEKPWYGLFKRGAPVLATDDDGNVVDIRLLMETGDFSKVVALRSEFERNPTPEFAHLLAWAYQMQGLALLESAASQRKDKKQRLLQLAVEKFQLATSINSSFSEAHKKLGSTLRELGQLEESLSAYDRAIAINQNDFEAWADRAAPLINQNRLAEAIDSASNALQHAIEPSSQAYALATRAAAHHFAGHRPEAANDLLAAWELHPATIVESIEAYGLHDPICVAEPSPRAVLLLAEMRWTKAAHEAANSNSGDAVTFAELAAQTLEVLIGIDSEEVVSEGPLPNDLIDDVLTRTAARLNVLDDKELRDNAVGRMQAWSKGIRGYELKALKQYTSRA